MRRMVGILLVAGLGVALSTSGAWAFKCPSLAKQTRELLSSTSSNTDKYAKAQALIEKGEGQHKDAQASLDEAPKFIRTP